MKKILFPFTVLLLLALTSCRQSEEIDFEVTRGEDETVYKLTERSIGDNWTVDYIPDGFEFVEERSNEHNVGLLYENHEDLISQGIVINMTGFSWTVETRGFDFYQVETNGRELDVYENQYYRAHHIIFYDEDSGALIRVSSTFDIDELIKVAASISGQ